MPEKSTVYIDMDDTLCDYQAGYAHHKALHPHIEFPQSQPGLYENLKPMSGAVEAWHWLSQHRGLDVYILTAPSIRNAHCYTEKRLWVERHLGLDAAYKFIISPNKGLNKGQFLIDDYVSGKGQEDFEGKILHFGSSDFPDWSAVVKFFEVSVKSG